MAAATLHQMMDCSRDARNTRSHSEIRISGLFLLLLQPSDMNSLHANSEPLPPFIPFVLLHNMLFQHWIHLTQAKEQMDNRISKVSCQSRQHPASEFCQPFLAPGQHSHYSLMLQCTYYKREALPRLWSCIKGLQDKDWLRLNAGYPDVTCLNHCFWAQTIPALIVPYLNQWCRRASWIPCSLIHNKHCYRHFLECSWGPAGRMSSFLWWNLRSKAQFSLLQQHYLCGWSAEAAKFCSIVWIVWEILGQGRCWQQQPGQAGLG